jgi:hypothetical protein
MKTFPDRIQDHLIGFKERQQYLPPTNPRKPWEYIEITDNLYPPIRNGFLQYAYDESIDFHDYARHVRSSQAFGFNLFYPLIKERSVLAAFPEAIRKNAGPVTEWHFEFQPRKDYLGEWAGDQQPIDYITSVDVALFFTRTTGERVAVLCEVKFTETGFSKCGGFSSRGNHDKKFCDGEFSWDHVENRCYLVSQKGRRYFQLTAGSHTHESTARCPFADNNQCQRNLAFANAIRGDTTDEAYFCLVHHDDNQVIQDAWDQYIALCLPEERLRLFRLKASDLVAHSSDETLRRYFEERYQIGSANKGLVRTGDPRTARQSAQP